MIDRFWDFIRPWVDADAGTEVGRIKYEEMWNASPIIAGQPITKYGTQDEHRGGWFGY